MLADVLREASAALQEQAGLYDAINMSQEQKRVMVMAKKAGAPMFFDPETTEGSAAAKKLHALQSSRLGRSLGLGGGDYLSKIPKSTYVACLDTFPMLRLLNQWDISRGSNDQTIIEYMKVVLNQGK